MTLRLKGRSQKRLEEGTLVTEPVPTEAGSAGPSGHLILRLTDLNWTITGSVAPAS